MKQLDKSAAVEFQQYLRPLKTLTAELCSEGGPFEHFKKVLFRVNNFANT